MRLLNLKSEGLIAFVEWEALRLGNLFLPFSLKIRIVFTNFGRLMKMISNE
jgi:hypothetical protein